ncbi:MAG TPA: Yip1 family protein [Thermoanaerobaculia bacterium]|nr:Yip1 family protein [Thermoanaerobaculia bacterium]
MDPGAPSAVIWPWAQPEALLDLVDDLRAAGYNIGVEQYLAVQDLVLVLAARGEDLADPGGLKRLLGPLLCSSPREQSDFGPRFDRWLEGHRPEPEPAKPGPVPAPRVSEWKHGLEGFDRWGRRLAWAGGFLALILAAAAVLPLASTSSGPSRPSTAELLFSHTALLLLPALALVGWLVWRWQARRFLRRRVTPGLAETARISLGRLHLDLFPRLTLGRIAQDLRRRREVASTQLNVAATLDRTVRQGGWLTPVYGRRQVTPEYLVLIDRVSPEDQQARFFEEILDGLAERGVFLSRYFFDRDPRTCFPSDDPSSPVALQALAAHAGSHRLLVFSDGAGLFSPLRPELELWTDLFSAWEERMLLTPELPEHWGFRESALGGLFRVFPATLEGMSSLVRSAGRGTKERRAEPCESCPFPEDLQAWPLAWIDRRSPEPSRVTEVFAELGRFLRDPGLYWLSACAAYPAMDWNLTLFLGDALRDEKGDRLLDPGRLAAMVRTPWLRHGYMPDWLRILLLSQLPRNHEREVRLAVQAWLLTGREGVADASVLEVARQHRGSFGALARHAARWLARREPPESPLRDRVFLTFLAGHRNLAVRLPMALRRVIPRPLTPLVGERAGNPWERRREIGVWRGFFQTLRLFTFSPVRGFSQTRASLPDALLFLLLQGVFWVPFIALLSSLSGGSISLLFTSPVVGFGMQFLTPLTAGLMFHAVLRAVARSRPLKQGLRGTICTLCYASVAFAPYNLSLAVPGLTCLGLGVLVFIVWWYFLCILGLSKIHELRIWRVAIAVLSPIAIVLLFAAGIYLSVAD